MNPNPNLGVLQVLGAASLWGATGTARSLTDGSLSADWFGALRLLTACAFFAGCALASRRRAGAPFLGSLATRDVLGAGLCMAVYNLAFFAGIGVVGVALGTAIALGSGSIWVGCCRRRCTGTGHPPNRAAGGMADRRRTDVHRRRPGRSGVHRRRHCGGLPYLLFSLALRHITPATA